MVLHFFLIYVFIIIFNVYGSYSFFFFRIQTVTNKHNFKDKNYKQKTA